MIRKPHLPQQAIHALSWALILSCTLVPAGAQPYYTISTFAGGGSAPLATPSRGVNDFIGTVSNLTADAAGNVYFPSGATVYKLDPSGILTRIAGTSHPGYSGDGGPATSAQLSRPLGLAVDAAGNVFIVDSGVRVRRVSPGGAIATVAGNGTPGYSGDGGPAVDAQLGSADAIAVDAAGNLFIAGGDNSVRKISTSGIISAVAGNGTAGFSGDGGPAIKAQVSNPTGLAVDATGNLYIADYQNLRVRKVSPEGTITTVAGNGAAGSSGDGGAALDAQLMGPIAIALDSAGNLYISDCDCDDDATGNSSIRKVSLSGSITTIAGNGTAGFGGDGGPATSALLDSSSAIAVDATGDLFIADFYNYRVRKVSPNGMIDTVAGIAPPPSPFSDGSPAASAQIGQVSAVIVDASGNVVFDDGEMHKVTADGIVHTVGNVSGNAIAADAAGNLFAGGSIIFKVSPAGLVSQVARAGTFGTPGVGAYGLAVDGAGNLFAGSGFVVSKIAPNGVVSTVAGNGGCCVPGDGGLATSANLNNATGVLLDSAGNLFVSETYGNRVRKVSPNGIITTVAGTGIGGFSGDGGQATSAQLNGPDGLALDAAGNLYIAETYGNRIRRVTPDGVIGTIAGTGAMGFSGDGGPAINAALSYPWGLAVDGQGNVYVADKINNRIRVLRPANTPVFIGAVVDAATQRAEAVSPGKIITIYGAGLGPALLVQNQPSGGQLGTSAGGTVVSFNGIPAPILYASSMQVAAIVPYGIGSGTVQVTVGYQGQTSANFPVSGAASAPGIFSTNERGEGQIAAINAVDGTVNSAVNPVKVGAYISLYATGEGQTLPAGSDGKLGSSAPPRPVLAVTVTVGGIPAIVQYAGGAPGQVAGLMQVNVQIPSGVHPGGYVPVVLQVGDASTTPDAMWIAVAGN